MPFLTRVPRESVPTVLEIIQYEALSTERKLAYLEEYLTMTALRQCEEYLKNDGIHLPCN